MKDILDKSKKIIRFWIIEVAINLLAIFIIITTIAALDSINIALLIFIVLLSFAIMIFKVVVFVMNIVLFLDIKKKYDLMLMGDKMERRGEFENLYSLKNNILIISIFEWLFPIVSLVFKVIYWNKIREIPSGENSDN